MSYEKQVKVKKKKKEAVLGVAVHELPLLGGNLLIKM